MTPQREAELLDFVGAKLFFICKEEKKLPWLDDKVRLIECYKRRDSDDVGLYAYSDESEKAYERLLGLSIIEQHKISDTLGVFIGLLGSFTLESNSFQEQYYECLNIIKKEEHAHYSRYVPPSDKQKNHELQQEFDVVKEELSPKETEYLKATTLKHSCYRVLAKIIQLIIVFPIIIFSAILLFKNSSVLFGIFILFFCVVYSVFWGFIFFKEYKNYKRVDFEHHKVKKIKIKKGFLKQFPKGGGGSGFNSSVSIEALCCFVLGMPYGFSVNNKFYVYFPHSSSSLSLYEDHDFEGELELVDANFSYIDGKPIYYGLSLKTDSVHYSVNDNYKNKFSVSRMELYAVSLFVALFSTPIVLTLVKHFNLDTSLNIPQILSEGYFLIAPWITIPTFFKVTLLYLLFVVIRIVLRFIYTKRSLSSCYKKLPYFMRNRWHRFSLFNRKRRSESKIGGQKTNEYTYKEQLLLAEKLNNARFSELVTKTDNVYEQSFVFDDDIYLKTDRNLLTIPLIPKSLFIAYFNIIYIFAFVSFSLYWSVVGQFPFSFLTFVCLFAVPLMLSKCARMHCGHVVFDRENQLVSFPNSFLSNRIYIPYSDVVASGSQLDDFYISKLHFNRVPCKRYKKRSYYFGSNCASFDKDLWSKVGEFMKC